MFHVKKKSVKLFAYKCHIIKNYFLYYRKEHRRGRSNDAGMVYVS